jgi:type IV secretory pathway VirD2 relaxase
MSSDDAFDFRPRLGRVRGRLYGAEIEEADGKAFTERGREDRHQFRFIVAPEDGEKLTDLRAFTRDVMGQMEKDLGTRLDWVAVDHFNTGHPHSHVIVRGRDDLGKDLIIAQDYITDGVRLRAQGHAQSSSAISTHKKGDLYTCLTQQKTPANPEIRGRLVTNPQLARG